MIHALAGPEPDETRRDPRARQLAHLITWNMDQACPSSAHPALHLPEILDRIFYHLESSELFKCSLVCSAWSSLAVASLWRYDTPDLASLLDMHQKGLLQKFVPMMRHIRIRCTEWCALWHYGARKDYGVPKDEHDFSKDFPQLYPQLKIISLRVATASSFNTKEYLAGYFQSSLRWLASSECDEHELFELLETECPYLEGIFVRPPHEGNDPRMNQDVLSFVSKMPQLREIGILRDIPNPTLLIVSKLANLETLSIRDFDSADWADSILKSTRYDQHPFPSLKELDLSGRNVSSLNIATLLSCSLFNGLRVLTLRCTISIKCSSMISQLAKCPQLTSVSLDLLKSGRKLEPEMAMGEVQGSFLHTQYLNENLQFDQMGWGEIAPENVKAFFRACNQLRQCKIFTLPALRVKNSDLCDALMLLPRIRTLDIPWSCSLGARELGTLRDFCPCIKELNLEKSTLNYGEFSAEESPRNLTITRFLGIRDERRNLWEPIKLPKSSMSETQRSESEKAEVFRRVLPAVYKDVLKARKRRLQGCEWASESEDSS